MIVLHNSETGALVGTLTEEQLQFLVAQLEEEHGEDQDYWLHRTQIEIFREQGADPSLLALLEAALGPADEVEVRWHRS
jgi:hypothetical protein